MYQKYENICFLKAFSYFYSGKRFNSRLYTYRKWYVFLLRFLRNKDINLSMTFVVIFALIYVILNNWIAILIPVEIHIFLLGISFTLMSKLLLETIKNRDRRSLSALSSTKLSVASVGFFSFVFDLHILRLFFFIGYQNDTSFDDIVKID